MNYTGTHPLNLISKVALIHPSASHLGASICRSLLNSNAFVLGLDTIPAHPTTRSGGGSHFQFLKYEKGNLPSGEEVIEVVGRKFGKEGVDFVVRCGGEREGEKRDLVRGIVDVMGRNSAGGLVLDVVGAEDVDGERWKRVIKEAPHIAKQLKEKGIRYNVIVPYAIEPNADLAMSDDVKSALMEHIAAHESKRKEGGYKKDTDRLLANIALFLCTEIGSGIEGLYIGIDGNATSL